jgi:hypothetical protein
MLAEIIPILTAILAAAPQVVTEVEAAWKLLTATTAPTTDEQAAIDAALEAAHKALQAS